MTKLVYDLKVVDADTLVSRFLGDGIVSVSSRDWECSYNPLKGDRAFYDRGLFIGDDANSIGLYGDSDFWEEDEDGCVYSTTPVEDVSIFLDGVYGVAVVYC